MLPEGVMLNYLARRETSIPYLNFMPPELLAFGEREIIASLDQSSPDFVVLVHKDASEFGVGFFGSDPNNGQMIMEWVDRHYESAQTILNEPLRDDRFGIRIMRRAANGQ